MKRDSILDRLSAVGKTWGVFLHDGGIVAGEASFDENGKKRVQKWEDFVKQAETGELPHYSWIDPAYVFNPNTNMPAQSQHPGDGAIPAGEKLIKDLYETVRASPLWNKSAIIITYDEAGGFWDHVPPPQNGVPNPDGIVPKPKQKDFNFDRLGMRVPFVVVSPWIKKNTVVHEPKGPTKTSQYDHTSIAATVKKIFGTKRFLTKRDAWAGTFEHIFSLKAPRKDCPLNLGRISGDAYLDGKGKSSGEKPLSALGCKILKQTKGSDKNCTRTERQAGNYIHMLIEKYGH